MTRFMNLAFQHMADTAERLNEFPEQFEPLFGLREVDGSELTIVEEWCFGYCGAWHFLTGQRCPIR